MQRNRLGLGVVWMASLAIACSTPPSMGGDASVDGAEPLPGQLGARCARNADCMTGLCLSGGRCTISCTRMADCPASWTCDAAASAGLVCQCAPSGTTEVCNGIDDDCDGRVDVDAMCPTGTVCEAGACMCLPSERCSGACVDQTTDALNCGACGHACPTGQVCEAGACSVMCSDTTMRCGSSCVDVTTDALHCGSCAMDCGGGSSCVDSACECSGTLVPCAMGCTDTDTDRANCGSCGIACASDEHCASGTCDCAAGRTRCGSTCPNLQTDALNCGTCGNACDAGSSCAMGSCVVGGGCPGTETRCGASCVDTQTNAANCGACAMTCGAGQTCQAGTCRAGMTTGTGTPCTSDVACASIMDGVCLLEADGWPGGYCVRLCTAPSDCSSGTLCADVGRADGMGACVLLCATSAECRASYSCQMVSSGEQLCLPM